MQIPNISLAYLIAELSPLIEGSILRKVQELENNWLKLKLQTRQGTKDLIISPNIFFITSSSLPAKQQSSGFGAFLRKRLSNKKVLSLKQHSFDRVALLEFDSYFLILELFAKGNVILATKGLEIVSAYRKEQWRDRRISKGEQYKFPSSKGISPLEVSPKGLEKILSKSESDCIRTIVSSLNIAPVIGEEACLSASVEKTIPAKSISSKKAAALLKALGGLYTIDLKRLKPGIAQNQMLPFEMKAAGKFEQDFSSLNAAIDGHFSGEFSQTIEQASGDGARERKAEKSLSRQKAAVSELENKIQENREKAEAIYANYAALSQALELARAFAAGKNAKEDVMYKLKTLGISLEQIDLKNKHIILDLPK